MFTIAQIKELVDLVVERGLGGLEIERAGFRLRIDGPRAISPSRAPLAPAPSGVSDESSASAAVDAAPATPSSAVVETRHILRSPTVGTFYAAQSPDAAPFVSPGDRVRKGQIVCIVEAMKLMNEIEADVDGKVVEVLARNGQPVDFGAPLFAMVA